MTTSTPPIVCIGSVLWDVIGRSASVMRVGSDVPGRITRIPGGVALNIAMAIARHGHRPVLLSAVGRDRDGDELLSECNRIGLETGLVYRSEDLPTDSYMAVEGANGVIAAIADAHSLEKAGRKILKALEDGALGSAAAPFDGTVALDGNLTQGLLEDIAHDALFARADLRIAPASPGKAERLQPFLRSGRGTLYVNLEEAGLLCQTEFPDSETAAAALIARGAQRAIVTDGGRGTCDATEGTRVTGTPPQVLVTRVTGAGDTFMAAHICAERDGASRADALTHALRVAARYVSGETGL